MCVRWTNGGCEKTLIETSDGSLIHVETWGNAHPAIVLLHGWSMSSAFWVRQKAALADAFRAYVTRCECIVCIPGIAVVVSPNARNIRPPRGPVVLFPHTTALSGRRFPFNRRPYIGVLGSPQTV
ncbi:MAG: alpha/beta hydrolase [Deltaproteobacteria bacterium]|nr:alpha/beta hydrolase [Deltaproteobacteria bacterium]